MTCKRCGAAMAADAVFCPVCGQRAEASGAMPSNGSMAATGFAKPGDLGGAPRSAAPVNNGGFGNPVGSYSGPTMKSVPTSMPRPIQTPPVAPAPQPAPAPGKYCPNCGNVVEATARFCNICGARMSTPTPTPISPPVPIPAPDTGNRSRGLKLGLLSGGCAAAALLLVLLLGVITNWFGLYGPATQILAAYRNISKEKSITSDFVIEGDFFGVDERVEGTVYSQIDYKKREVTIYAEIEADGEDVVLALYDGYLIVDNGYECYKQNLRNEIEDYFDEHEKKDAEEFSWEKLFDNNYYISYDEVSEYIDFDALNECLKDYFKKLNSKKWLKENAGYSMEREGLAKQHCFTVEAEFLKASIAFFEDAIRDREDYEEIYDDIIEAAEADDDAALDVTVGIKGGNLVSLTVALSDAEESLGYMECNYSDIGRTEIDTEMLEDLLDSAA